MGDFFESELTCEIELKPHQLHKDYIDDIVKTVKRQYENKCHPKIGFIKKNSIKLIKKTAGVINGSKFTGEVSFKLTFSCLVARPIKDSILLCVVTKKGPTGLIAYPHQPLPYNIIIAKNLEQDEDRRALIDSVKVEDIIEISVIDSQLHAGDRRNKRAQYMVLGRVNKTNISNVKISNLESQILGDELKLIGQLSEVPDMKHFELWKDRNQYTTSKVIYSELSELKDQILEINLDAESAGYRSKGRKYWDIVKMLINDYELVTDPQLSKLSADGIPVSRAFYKMYEMIREENDIFNILPKHNMRILNIAESPGGFVQALLYSRRYDLAGEGADLTDDFTVVSLPERPDVELWSELRTKTLKSIGDDYPQFGEHLVFLDEDKEVDPSARSAGTAYVHLINAEHGDLTNPENVRYLLEERRFSEDKADLVTADGGFDVDNEYNYQEISHYKLFFAETLIALSSQKRGGTFVLKIYDSLTQFTVELLALLSYFYTDIRLYKPLTSRQANSEKYVICSDFEGIDDETLHTLTEILEKWPTTEGATVSSVFSTMPITDRFIEQVKVYNTKFTQIEMHNISDGLTRARHMIKLMSKGQKRDIDAYRDARRTFQEKQSVEFLRKLGLPLTDRAKEIGVA